MAEGNGYSGSGMASPPEVVTFRIGNEDVKVPVMMFVDLDECKPQLKALDAGLDWVTYAGLVMRVAAHQVIAYQHPDLDFEEREKLAEELFTKFRRKCTAGEAQVLAARMNDLYRASGFSIPEAEPTDPAPGNPGTGTSTPSASASQAEEFAVTTRDS